MPWCENKECGKKNLKKTEVVFDEVNRRVLCVPCGLDTAVQDTAVAGELVDKVWFGLGYVSDRGLKAEAIYGGTRLELNITNDQFMRFLGQ